MNFYLPRLLILMILASGLIACGGGGGDEKPPSYPVSTSTGANGSISPTSVSVNQNKTTRFTITPDSGYSILSVTGCGGSLAGNIYTTGAITADCTISVNFILSYTVSTSASANGSINPTSAIVHLNDTTNLTVTPDTGYSINSASGCGGSLTVNTFTTGPITANCTVSASFSINSYSVSTSAGVNGNISPGSAIVDYGNTTNFTVTPDANYSIDSISGCGGSLLGNTYTTGIITANCTISASFVDSTAPTASITFPPPTSYTEGGTITVRGTASDDSEITVVKINSVDAASSDNYANWQVAVSLVTGSNALTVETGDIVLNTDASAASAQIRTAGQPFITPQCVALDIDNNRALVVDATLDALIAVDLSSGVRTTLSDSSTPDTTNAFSNPTSVVLNGANSALVIDYDLDVLLAVNLSTGARSIISGGSIPPAGANPFVSPFAMVLDSDNNRVLVVDNGQPFLTIDDVLLAVDLSTGARTIISGGSIPPAGANPFQLPFGITLDSVNNRALVVDAGLDAVLAVDLSTGARTIISNSSKPDAANAFDFPVDVMLSGANTALVVDAGLDAVLAVDLSTGARSIISDSSTPDAANAFDLPVGLELDSDNNRVLVIDQGLKTLLSVDLSSGVRSIVPDSSTPDANNPFSDPISVVLDSANNQMLIVDQALAALIAVELNTGARSIVSDGGTLPAFVTPTNVALIDATTALVTDDGLDALVAVNISDGVRTIISDSSTPPAGANPFDTPTSVALKDATTALVVDDGLDALIAVNISDGVRTIISDSSTPPAGANPFVTPTSVALMDATTALVVDDGLDALIAVNISDGARTVISDSSKPPAGANAFVTPTNVILNSTNTALVTDTGLNALIEVDLTTGARTIISGSSSPDAINPFFSPVGVALDNNNNALVIDSSLRALIAVDQTTGQRVFFSR